MDSLKLLKEEINQTTQSEHDFAKWKLIVVAGIGAAALGLGKDTLNNNYYWLVIFIPFVCAYIDLHSYQYQTKIMVLARFIREQGEEDPILCVYEKVCEKFRKDNVFYLGQAANLLASILLTLASAGVVIYKGGETGSKFANTLWIGGIALIIGLWLYHKRVVKGVNKAVVDLTPKAAATSSL